MERAEPEKPSEDGAQLNRNRSFKTKQLVRSQAIRESQSPPRALTPSPAPADAQNNVNNNVKNNVNNNVKNNVNNNVASNDAGDIRSECRIDECEKDSCGDKKQTVEIQITGREWDPPPPPTPTEQRHRARRWLHKHHSEPTRDRDLLSNHPRVSCVCGKCANCPHCRGRRRRHICTIKQDSGIACSDDCPDCLDTETTGPDGYRKSESLEEHIYYCRCPERKEKPKYISLSRTDSEERLEPTGAELVAFIKEVLNKDARDRQTMLKIERELHSLVSDAGRCIVRFPVMTSYGRMLVHRCASLFQLSHHLDQSNKNSVLVSKSGTSGGRIPCTSFRQWCVVNFPPIAPIAPDTRAKSILKRDTNSLDEPGSGALANSRSKSLEQREKDYERMKRRIFTEDNCTQDESQWPWLSSGPVKLLTPDTARNKLVKVQSLESGPSPSGGRGVVSKSHSFGGYGGRDPPHPRLLSRQGDLASSSWRLSPSSSGYKTLSLRSTDSVTPSPTGGASPEPGALPGAVVCAVTDMGCVPPGALLIHPQTGRPLTNPDGSLYHYDPTQPPPPYQCNNYHDDKIDQSNEKKRGKLEKQHSFIDHECECPPSEDTRNSKCCCASPRHDSAHRNSEKTVVDQQPQDQPSPTKSHYEQTDTPTETNLYDDTPSEVVEYESNKTQPYAPGDTTYEANYDNFETDQNVYEACAKATNQIPLFEPAANQRQDNVVVNSRISKLTNQDSQEFYTQQTYGYIRNDEVTSPQSQHGSHGYPQVEMGVQAMVQAKGTPVQIQDPHLRPVSLTNMTSYPTTVHQGYSPYQYRMEQSLQPVYHPGQLVSTTEEHKVTSSPQQEPTFRIDPSYPYAALDFAAQCGACVDPNTMRSYSLPYGGVEAPAYPLANVMLQPQLQHYPYQDVQWQPQPMLPVQPKLVVPDLYPVYPGVYPYNLLYPQVIPQPYPICQPVYGVVEKPPSRSNSTASASANIHASVHANAVASAFANAHEAHGDGGDNRAPSTHSIDNSTNIRNSHEIAAKIQQIKEQMAQLHTRDPRANNYNNNSYINGNYNNNSYNNRRDDFRRRNNGHGILGSYPHTRPQRPPHDETQLSSAARAIVNSIRNMQAKNHYQDRREFQYRVDRPEYRRRPERDGDRLERDGCDRDYRPRPPLQCRPPHALRQMSPGTWCRRSPAPVHPVMNHPRRPHPDARNNRR